MPLRLLRFPDREAQASRTSLARYGRLPVGQPIRPTVYTPENHPALVMFYNNILLPILQENGLPAFTAMMVIDGNDPRGSDVGILARKPMRRMHSHANEVDSNGRLVFSRDFPEYHIGIRRNTHQRPTTIVSGRAFEKLDHISDRPHSLRFRQ